jgi:SPP1 family predicted phage head-tail adaptor
MAMRAGALRNLIQILRPHETGRDEENKPIVTWPLFAEPFCEIVAKRGTEQFDPATKQRFSQVVYRFRCRYVEVIGIDATMRIEHEGQKYDIRGILPDEQQRDDVIIEATLQDGSI